MSEVSINPDELPSGWATTTLGTVVNYGDTNKAEPSEIADSDWILELEDIEKDSSRLLQRVTFSERRSKSTKNSFKAGDILYGKLRPYLNKVLIADQAGYCSTEVLPLETAEHLDNRYLFYWLKHPIFLKYVEAESHGMNMPRLGTDTGRAAPFVLAPYAEQTRIADQLDVLLARVQACNDRFDAIPGLIKRFRQSILTDAITRKTTTDWRQVNGDYDWPNTTLDSICASDRVITYGVVKLGDEVQNGIPCLRTSNVRWLNFELKGIKKISSRISQEYARTILLGGEVLVNVRGTLGGVAVAQAEMKGWNVSREIAVLPVSPFVANSEFVAFWIGSEASQKWLAKMEKGVAYVGINIEDLRMLPIKLPSLLEQTEIVRRVKALFTLADRIEARYTAARAYAQRLTPLLLAKAFRGELVPQDPNDEPASALLQRIAAQRAQAELLPKIRKPRTARAARAPKETAGMTKSRQDADVKDQPYLADHLRSLGGAHTAEALFKVAELPVADFYKQLAWEVDKGHIKDHKTALEAGHAP